MRNYRAQTPQIVSILYRKLKPGQTFEDFQKAHLPPGDCHKTEYGYDVDYFNSPTRVINAISATDPTMVISVGLTYGDYQAVFSEVNEKLPSEAARRDKIALVSDKIGDTGVYFVASDNNYGKDVEYSQLPTVDITPELVVEINDIMTRSKK